jgi:hypothetical protein
MAPLLGRKPKPIEFGEGALRFLRQDYALDSVQLRRCRLSKGQGLGRSFPGFLGVCLHGAMIAQTGFGLKPAIPEPAKASGYLKKLQSNCKHTALNVIAAGFQPDFIVRTTVCSVIVLGFRSANPMQS